VSAMKPQNQESRSSLTTIEASTKYRHSSNYIWQLVRSGRIDGYKKGRDWFVYEDSLQAFLAQPRAVGRKKGSRKERIIRHTERGERVLLSTAEAHEHYGYRQDSLLRLRRTGHIEAEKIGGQWYIFEDSLLAYKNRQPRKRQFAPSMSEEPPLPSDE
jgi:hypothetical protein